MNVKTVSNTTSQRMHRGNAAVDGLIAGTAAGIAMMGYLLLTSGDAPADLLNRFASNGMTPSPLISLTGHLAVSALYGMIFSVAWYALRGSSRHVLRMSAGLVYSLVLFAIAEWVILPVLQSPLLDIPTIHWGIAHALYGIVLGLVNRPMRQNLG